MPDIKYVVLPFFLFYTSAYGALPKNIQAFMDLLPNNTLDLDVVIGKSMETSDEFRAVAAEKIRPQSNYYQSIISQEPLIQISASRAVSRNEQLSPFAPNRFQTNTVSLGIAKKFFTGTLLSAEISHNFTEYEFLSPGITSPLQGFETKATLTLSQSLWKDFFGYQTRKQEEAGEKLTLASDAIANQGIENWMISLTQLFYQAWFFQKQTEAAKANVDRRKKLLEITKLKAKRGTAEKPDVLQVESALLNSQIQYQEAKNNLGQLWRKLVTSLKLPKAWLDLDATQIPMSPDQPESSALTLCQGPMPETNAVVDQYKAQSEAARLKMEIAKNSFAPDIKLTGSIDSNGIDRSSASPTWNESFTGKNPAWSIGITAQIPLGFYAEKAQIITATADYERSDALASYEKGNLRVLWVNACADLIRWKQVYNNTTVIEKKQEIRERLESKRFRLGRIPIINIIQAGDDFTQAQVAKRQTQMNYKMASWKVKQLANQIPVYLKSLEKKFNMSQNAR